EADQDARAGDADDGAVPVVVSGGDGAGVRAAVAGITLAPGGLASLGSGKSYPLRAPCDAYGPAVLGNARTTRPPAAAAGNKNSQHRDRGTGVRNALSIAPVPRTRFPDGDA